jgi:hypothetical protein
MTSLSLYKILSLSNIKIMSAKNLMPMLAGVGLLSMCCISSSIASTIMGGGETIEETKPVETTPDEEFVYEFIVNVPHHSAIGHHINDFLVDGVKPPPGSVVLYESPDRGDTPAPDSYLWDGDATTQVAYNSQQKKDELFMTVTLNKRPNKFTIGYERPLYAPGWIIKENGVAIITETENRGGEHTPTPIAYDYVLP